ncbi:hypothetical protein BZM27_09290 [Paraburkholderia steynii]|uniref:DUF2059 domain-containing protein n=1 Tax=Paraburkholderia steynii TaxID=1245441 RepID=A0A4R0XEW7_9BURK|nr:hypothetical protein BZM27_09290 [Paraburkholderia steynii]
MRFLFSLLLMIALVSARQACADELTPAKRSDIMLLLQVTRSANVVVQISSALAKPVFANLKAARPDIPDRAYTVAENEIKVILSEHISTSGGLLDQIVPVYDKYYTHQEIRELLAFYQSPIGKKVILAMPSMLNESMMAGQRWAEALGPEIRARLSDSLKREGLLTTSR